MQPPRHSYDYSYDHTDCSNRACKYESVVDDDNYQVVHMRSDCDCKLVGPSPEILKDIIESGHFPVISLTDSGNVKVESSNAVRGGYVSVSHVWSDGHGNPDDNTLPTCFLTYLSYCVDNALGAGQSPFDLRSYSQLPSMLSRQLKLGHNPKRFWIDTLCIPRYPLELRARAISRMRDPFEKANVNLILDTSLTFVRAEDMSHIEMFARLKISNWARRLWTYHEDAVASSNNINLVQFQDRSIDILRQGIPVRRSFKTMSDAMAKFQRSREVSDSMKVADLGSAFNSAIRGFGESNRYLFPTLSRYGLSSHGYLNLGLHWYRFVLETKSTSRESDQALCLASLMGLDIQKVAEAKSEEKMKVFWSLIDSLPLGILFSKSKMKLDFEGLRWAPASFLEVNSDWMGPKGLHKRYIPRSAKDQGLRAKLSAIFLKPQSDGKDGIDVDRLTVESLFEHIHGSGHEARFFDSEGTGWNMHFEKDWHNRQRYLAHTDGLAIVLEPCNIKPGTSYRGLMVSYKQCDGHFQAQAHRHVRVKKVSRALPRLVQGFKACTREMLSRYDSDFLAQLLWPSKNSDEWERVDEAKKHLKECLNQQDGFVEEDCDYWRQFFKDSDNHSGNNTRERQRIDTVVMWCLLRPNVEAELADGKLWFCID